MAPIRRCYVLMIIKNYQLLFTNCNLKSLKYEYNVFIINIENYKMHKYILTL